MRATVRSPVKMRLHVVVPIVTEGFRDPAAFSDLLDGRADVTQSQIARGPASIECQLDEMLAAPEVIAETLAAEQSGADAVVIDCMGDPGLGGAREVVSIPVLGPCQTSMHIAAMLGHRFSVITVLENLVHEFRDSAIKYGVEQQLASTRAVDIPVLDLDEDRDRLLKVLTEQSVRAVEDDGAHVLVFGCTGMLGLADDLVESLSSAGYDDIPVIDPIPTTLRVAAGLVASSLTHSKRTYPSPPPKLRIGYSAS
jgi:allantoin racemase